MPNIIIGPLPVPIGAPLLWLLKKLVEHLPAIVLPQALALLDQVMDPKTAPWKRAAIAAVLIELVALVNASVPIAVIVRFAVLNAAFNSQAPKLRVEEREQVQVA